MGDLAGRPGLGPKAPKQLAKARKAIPTQSAKRIAYLASEARVECLAHMGLVAQLPCLICGAVQVEVHHMPDPRSDMRVIPLCPKHHRREYGAGAYHYSPRAFHELHGSAEWLLSGVCVRLQRL